MPFFDLLQTKSIMIGARVTTDHKDLRHKACQWLEVNKDYCNAFFLDDEDIDKHIREMRKVPTHATNHEIFALSAILNRAIYIHSYDCIDHPLVILHDSVEHQSGPPLLFSFHRDNHYNLLYPSSGSSNDIEGLNSSTPAIKTNLLPPQSLRCRMALLPGGDMEMNLLCHWIHWMGNQLD